MGVTFEETTGTLQTAQITTGLTGGSLIPYLIWKVISMGAHRRTVFMQAVQQTDALIGVEGNEIRVPVLGQGEFTMATISEANLDNNGFTKTRLSPDSVSISIGDVAYVASRISDILLEDSPRLGWIRATLIKMGEAMAEGIDAAVRDVLIAGAGQTTAATTAGTLVYGDIIRLKTLMRTASMFESEGGPFMMFIHPAQEQDLLLNFGIGVGAAGAVYVPVERYSVGTIPLVAERGLFAGCRVLVTDNATAATAIVVAPPTHSFGPPAIFAWKRHLKSESWRGEQAQYGRTVYLISARYGCSVIQADLVGTVTAC